CSFAISALRTPDYATVHSDRSQSRRRSLPRGLDQDAPFVFVAGDIGRLYGGAKVKQNGHVHLGTLLADVVRDESSDILGKRNSQLRSFGLSTPLQFRIHRDLGARVHDGAIMPSPDIARKLMRRLFVRCRGVCPKGYEMSPAVR